MTKYKANPKKLANNTQPGEQSIFIGARDSSALLPTILQTDTNKRFLKTTLDNLMSSGNTETIDTYWGRISGSSYDPSLDVYNPEHTSTRLNYQLSNGFSVGENSEFIDSVSYIEFLKALEQSGADTTNLDRLLTEVGYTLSLPIDVDMFVNHTNYFWLVDDIPICIVNPTVDDPIDIDSILSLSNYTTPVLSNGKILTFLNGMRVMFMGDNVTSTSGEYFTGYTYIVEGVGSGRISFVAQYDDDNNNLFSRVQPYTTKEPSTWDTAPWDTVPWDFSTFKNNQKEYVVMNRASADKNPWARVNQWYSVYAIRETSSFNELDPSVLITNETRGNYPIIQFYKDMELYNTGTSLVYTVDHFITDVSNPDTEIEGEVQFENNGLFLQDDDLVLFTNAGSFSNKIYRVSGTGTSIVLTQEYEPTTSGDKVLVIHAYDPAVSGNEIYWNGSTWVIGQQKESIGSAPLFNLYSYSGDALNDFSDNSFSGDPIWRYKPGNGILNTELGFVPSYNEAASNEVNFELTINNKRYFYDNGSINTKEIVGDYYYRDTSTGKHYSVWLPIRGDQRVPYTKTMVVETDNTSVVFDLGSNKLNRPTEFIVDSTDAGFLIKEVGAYEEHSYKEATPSLILERGTEYTFSDYVPDVSYQIDFYDPYGNSSAEIVTSRTGNVITVEITDDYPFSTVTYRKAGSAISSETGIISLSDKNFSRVKVKKNGELLHHGVDFIISGQEVSITEVASKNDVFSVSAVIDEYVEGGVFEQAPVYARNPLNEPITTVSFGGLFKHLETQISSMPGFDGNFFGENSLHSTMVIPNYDGTIVQQIRSPFQIAYLLSKAETNPLNSIRSLAKDYQSFMTAFKTKVKQLWNTSSSSTTIPGIVDNALRQINIGKNKNSKYANSDMAYFGQPERYTFDADGVEDTFTLGSAVNKIGKTKDHVYVTITETVGTETVVYSVDPSLYSVAIDQVIFSSSSIPSNGSTVTVKVYRSGSSYSYIPPSLSKLGMRYAGSLLDGSTTIRLHDGSEYTSDIAADSNDFIEMFSPTFDIVGASLRELDIRIRSGMVTDQPITRNMNHYYPNVNIAQPVELNKINSVLDNWYNRWNTNDDVESFSDVNYYNPSDEFTWNYSSVGPKIGGWEGLYLYYFGTTAPHTRPWEMLGHDVKPTWWDDVYSWTDPTERANLIFALKNGVYGNPNTTADIDVQFRRSGYDWDSNTLVTVGGVLNGPVTAGVVPSPSSIDASKDFSFGDYGQYESVWRSTVDYQFALAEAFLLTKPVTFFEDFWEMGRIISTEKDPDTASFPYAQMYLSERNPTRSSIQEVSVHNTPISGIVTSADVGFSGSGYSNPTAESTETTGQLVEILLRAADGEIKAASINYGGTEYRNDSVTTISDVGGSFGGLVELLVEYDFVLPVPGLNMAVVEWGNDFGITPESINETLNNLSDNLVIHLSGFSDKNIISPILDGSYTRGKVPIPIQDFDIILSKTTGNTPVFYSGVKVTRDGNSYRVYGFDNDDHSFKFYEPSSGGSVFTETVTPTFNVDRYLNFKGKPTTVPYGKRFTRRQDLYNFLIGLGKYYESIGFSVFDSWKSDAIEVIRWSLDTSPDECYVNGIDSTLDYTHGEYGIVDDLSYKYNGYPNVLDKSKRSINPGNLLVIREDNTTIIEPKSVDTEVFGLRLTPVEYEHVLVFKNVTGFNDLVYSPSLGLTQPRIKLSGERSRNWTGRFDAPGYLIRQGGIIVNAESSVREIERDNINTVSKTLNRLTRQTARFNTGYSGATYLSNTFVDGDSAYKFNKGERKYKGTVAAVDAFMRNANVFGIRPDYRIFDEWMIRLGDYGDTTTRDPIEVEVEPGTVKTNPQVLRFNDDFVVDNDSDLVIDYRPGAANVVSGYPYSGLPLLPIKKSGNVSISDSSVFSDHSRDAGLPLSTETDFKIGSIDDIASVFDITADYANIENWNAVKSYKKNDLVRKDGKVLKLTIDSTGLNFQSDPISVRGTIIYPIVPSNSTVVIDGTTVNFSKSATTTNYQQITIVGSVQNPLVNNNSSLIIDGAEITLTQSETQIIYDDIVVTGNIGNPVIVGDQVGGFDSTLLIDGTVINFTDNESVIVNITARAAFRDSFESAFTTAADPTVYSEDRIAAFKALRLAIITEEGQSFWDTWISSYFTSPHNVSGVNTDFLATEYDAAPVYQAEIGVLFQSDVDVINAILGTSFDISSNRPDSTSVTDTLTALDVTSYIQDVTDHLLTGVDISNTTIVTTDTSSQPVEYDITEIVDKINSDLLAASVTNVTASESASGNFLVLTKIPSTGDTDLVIGAGTENAAVGFPAASTAFPATSTTVVVGTQLSLATVVNQINAAGITNVSAGTSGDYLEIRSTNQSINIGIASANSQLGISSGVTNAASSVTNTTIDLQIYDIVSQINSANISGVVASNVNNNVVITSTNPQLVIGSGSANTNIGILPGTFTSSDRIENIFDPADWIKVEDPAMFSIWLLDNIGTSTSADVSRPRGYNVYQVFDFELGITEVCAGTETGDDALVKLTGDHYLEVNDHVLLLNTTSTPSIDGIKRVTKIADSSKFYVDSFIEEKGFDGKVLILRPTRFSDSTELFNTLTDNAYVSGTTLGWKPSMFAYVDNDIIDGSQTNEGAVYQCVIDYSTGGVSFERVRLQERRPDNKSLLNAVIYDKNDNTFIKQLEVFDPIEGIIPGVADREIDIKQSYDAAVYTATNDNTVPTDPSNAWASERVGITWWDRSTSVYYDYQQGSLSYRQGNWGKLYPTSNIDIYEWTKSPVLPEEYADAVASSTLVDGVTLSGVPYTQESQDGRILYYWSEEITYNSASNREEVFYYFWVKNKTTVPNQDRRYSVLQLESIVQKPELYDIDWVAIASNDSILVSRMDQYVNNDTVVVQVTTRTPDSDYHQEFTLLAEGDSVIPEWLHVGMRDSLSKYDNYSELESFVFWDVATNYEINDLVRTTLGLYRARTANVGTDPDLDSGDNWKFMYDVSYEYNGAVDGEMVRIPMPHHVPDETLHPLNKYGTLIRPRQSWIIDVPEARRVLTQKLNEMLLTINLVDTSPNWGKVLTSSVTLGEVTYDYRQYWVPTDWSVPGFEYNADTDFTVGRVPDLSSLSPVNGNTALVITSDDEDGINRSQVFQYVAGNWILKYKENATIRFVDGMWNPSQGGWDSSPFDQSPWDNDFGARWTDILDTVRADIFVGQYRSMYNELWFTMLRYIHSEQPNLDWAIKSTYIRAAIYLPFNESTRQYVPERLEELFDYINKVKPFHTKMREILINRTASENVGVTISEDLSVSLFDELDLELVEIIDDIPDIDDPDVEVDNAINGGLINETTIN